ncbi:MAG TPA: DUF1343 domain-containing protein [Phycisphaerae bacterium]|nr:DUF1343 domain-containing protein [Phycisphaerae bacterium]
MRHMRAAVVLAGLPGLFASASAEVKFSRPPVQTGIDVLIADGFKELAGKSVGLITNPTGVASDLQSTIDVLHKASSVKLVALFGPEHGVRGDVFGGQKIEDSRDPATNLPVFSLYGKTRKPTPAMLKGIDVLVYDIQDIGSRSYTFISTMGTCMEAAAENGIEFVVLDRPNPLTGNKVEGRPLDLKYASFVGQYPIPYVYGMTCGELARMINGDGWLKEGVKCRLTVIAMRGWERSMWFDQTRLPWVPTSPHIPRADVALFYAATGIMGELQVVSEGVGYTLPFELAGAPFITDAEAFAKELNGRGLPGVVFRPTYFRPYYIDRVKDKQCGGVQIHITDRDRAELTTIQFHVMDAVRKLYPKVKLFGNKRDEMFDKVCGTDQVRVMFEAGRPIAEIVRFWNDGLKSFMRKREGYLIYR